MKYLKIKDWDRWQTFRKDRGTPPWIKIYRNLFSNPDWMELSDSEKGQLVSMWVAAADKSGQLPNNSKIIQKMCFLDEPPNLRRFKDLGFIDGQLVDSLATTCQPNGNHLPTINVKLDAPETETETETEEKNMLCKDKPLAPNSRENFETAWDAYPEKKGKEKAFTHFKAQVKTEKDFQDLGKAMVNYIQDVARQRASAFPDLLWLNGATFFNKRWKDYINYTPPAKQSADGIPAQRDMKKDELQSYIHNQFDFVHGEIMGGKCEFGEMNASTWLWMAIGKKIVEFEQRFALDPLNETQRQFYDSVVAEYKLQDDLVEGVA